MSCFSSIDASKSSAAAATPATGEFAGKRVLVTGGTRGIGRAIAQKFAAGGARVAVTARSPPKSGATKADGGATANAAASCEPELFIAADVSTVAGCALISSTVLSTWGGVDILINNAGGSSATPGGALAQTDDIWMADLQVNLLASVRLDRALLPQMVAQKSGCIVHISTISSRKPMWEQTLAYGAAKAALNNYSKGLSLEFASRGVRINTVAPGFTESDGAVGMVSALASAVGKPYDAAREMLVQAVGIPCGAPGRPEDIAEIVAFVASDRCKYLQGALINVDGGTWNML